ncbi:MAG: zinc-binding dehydrogenase [Gaiellaceae bacterium]
MAVATSTVATSNPRATMAAATVSAAGQAELVHVPAPVPQAGEVLIRVEGCGLCGSSGSLWEGRPWFSYPLRPGAPGHEGWGRVEELGEGVTSPSPGTRVAFLSQHAFAELDVARADAVVTLPPELDERPFPGEALGCAMNVFARSRIAAGDTVAVVGAGFVGLLLVRLATLVGAHVTALSRRGFALELAERLGAVHTNGLDEAGDDERFDCVIEAAGVQETLDVAARLTRERGLLVIAGYHQDGPRTIDMQLWNWRGLDVVNAHERDPAAYVAGMRQAADAVARGLLEPDLLYTHRFPLAELDLAFEAARERPDGFLKALVLV